MSDAVVKDQPEVAAEATEVQAAQDATPVVENTDETADKQTDAAAEGQNGVVKAPENMLKTTAKPDPKDHRRNRKYDPTTQPVTDDPVKIRNQVSSPPRLALPPKAPARH
jgi:lupus La protein